MKIDNSERYVNWAALGVALVLFAAYLYNLTGWLIFDDEGEYLYQVWRMTLGEMPYRDFLTPQLPLFLYAATAVMKLFGPSVFVMRLYSVLLAFVTGLMLFVAGRKHHSALTGLLAMALFLLHADVFKETRIFRNEPIFLLFVTAGIVLATWPTERRRRILVVAGACFGLATLVKLFGLLPAGGVGLWLIADTVRRKRLLREFLLDSLAFSAPVVLLLVAVGGVFMWFVPDFLHLVLGHHLAQGVNLSFGEIIQRKIALYLEYFTFYPVFVSLAIFSIVMGVVRYDNRRRWAWQIPAVFAFLVLSRQFGQRHFMFLLPALSLLVAWLLADGINGCFWNGRHHWLGKTLSSLALLLILVPAIRQSIDRASWIDTETQPILDLISENTQPGDFILTDDIGLAFHAQRATTYSGAALSHGAVTSGQITGEQLIDEIAQDNVQIVIADTSLLTGNHLVFLRDYPRFHRFLERNFLHVGNFRRDFQELDVWVRKNDQPFISDDSLVIEYQDNTQFGVTMRLLGYDLPTAPLMPGDTLNFTLYWTSDSPAENYWSVFTHLVGPDGAIAGQNDKIPYDGVYPPDRWWPGQIIDDKYAISISPDAVPGEYRIQLGMYDWISGERLPLWSASGETIPDAQIELDRVITIAPKS